ncbi:hypothetical protein [Sphingomonas lenta]|uniref:PRC-barrel domain-containing protein n=1 Tax=Sphingomonas lenta TaxID=1141887 RepID=A0A2A2SK90_9SPHN|nr:hypothetical protein [Sphingomonas lenta]PAX09570.1 hypothetical protein CKY28_02155 [Sphingomonas lenta]
MKFLTGTAFGALTFVAAAASAQTAPTAGAQTTPAPAPAAGAQATATPTVGATVYDSTGAVLGQIKQVTPQAVVVDVGGTPAALPPTSISAGPRGLQATVSRADVEAQARQAQGQALQQQLTAGAQVRGAAGATIGTIKSVDGTNVTVTTPKGDVVLPVSGFAAGPNGPVVGLTQAQLDAAITAAGGGSASTGASSTAAETTGAADTGAATTTPEAGAGAAAGAATGAAATRATTRTQTRTRTRRTTRSNR